MYLGIDVGGTHTDAVIMDAGKVRVSCKKTTNHNDLLESVRAALSEVLADIPPSAVTRLNLSTTLSTNAIVQGRIEDVGVLVSAGPGMDPEDFRIGPSYHVLHGSIDHRGHEILALDAAELDQAANACRDMGIQAYAVATKFSTRNPAQENQILDRIQDQAAVATLGHRLSGLLNFPRRVATAYYNSAVWRIYNGFADAVEDAARELGLTAP
ncbi:MAG: hydantoinase/oxoprolinase family protein, partial [Desulfovibrio sp.]